MPTRRSATSSSASSAAPGTRTSRTPAATTAATSGASSRSANTPERGGASRAMPVGLTRWSPSGRSCSISPGRSSPRAVAGDSPPGEGGRPAAPGGRPRSGDARHSCHHDVRGATRRRDRSRGDVQARLDRHLARRRNLRIPPGRRRRPDEAEQFRRRNQDRPPSRGRRNLLRPRRLRHGRMGPINLEDVRLAVLGEPRACT